MTKTFNDAAREACYAVAAGGRRPATLLVQLINERLDEAYAEDDDGFGLTPRDFIQLGQLAHELAEELGFKHSFEDLAQMMCSKQLDYGPQNILRRGPKGVLVRMTDKIARIENLVSKNRTAVNESLEDSVLDLQVYAAIGIMLLKNEFELTVDELQVKRAVKTTKLEDFFKPGPPPYTWSYHSEPLLKGDA